MIVNRVYLNDKNMRRLCFLCGLSLGLSACGPDLDPQKYLMKSILLSSYEEYSFQYMGDLPQKMTGTDSIRLDYKYYRDSTSIRQYNQSKLINRIQLVYSGSQLVKSKIKWQFGRITYKDSILFSYSGGNLSSFVHRGGTYQVVVQKGNVVSMKRGIGVLSASYTAAYDQVVNPLKSLYWLDHLILPSGATTTLQPLAIARYFSANNITLGVGQLLGVTTTQRYFYSYLRGILPKAINYEIEEAKSKVTDLVYAFDIQYVKRDSSAPLP